MRVHEQYLCRVRAAAELGIRRWKGGAAHRRGRRAVASLGLSLHCYTHTHAGARLRGGGGGGGGNHLVGLGGDGRAAAATEALLFGFESAAASGSAHKASRC